MEGASARSLFRAAFLLCGWIFCLSFLPSIDPTLQFISAVFCCSNFFSSPQPKWQLCQENGSEQHCHTENLVLLMCMLMYENCSFFFSFFVSSYITTSHLFCMFPVSIHGILRNSKHTALHYSFSAAQTQILMSECSVFSLSTSCQKIKYFSSVTVYYAEEHETV